MLNLYNHKKNQLVLILLFILIIVKRKGMGYFILSMLMIPVEWTLVKIGRVCLDFGGYGMIFGWGLEGRRKLEGMRIVGGCWHVWRGLIVIPCLIIYPSLDCSIPHNFLYCQPLIFFPHFDQPSAPISLLQPPTPQSQPQQWPLSSISC